jgi:hypothetical protein
LQTGADGTRREFEADVTLLAMDETFDFALLRAALPLKTNYIPFEPYEIGPDVLTLGYPGDRSDPELGGTLTYSTGKLTGFRSRGFATTAVINGGASGSPMLNARTLRVFGLLSNGSGVSLDENGAMPGLAQPIHEIDRVFGIRGYLNGEKQKRIGKTISELAAAKDYYEASELVANYLAERTLIGRARLKMIMVNHESRDVRRAILNKMKFD